MEIWIIMGLPVAAAVLLVDYLLRRKKWKENTRGEKVSLIVNMASSVPHMFLSAYGMLLGITGYGAETAVGRVLEEVALTLAGVYFAVAVVAMIGALILRKMGKAQASIWINVIAFVYIVLMAVVYYLAGTFL